jgi:hypothetical protein
MTDRVQHESWGMSRRANPARHSPLELLQADPKNDQRICPLCGEFGSAHAPVRDVHSREGSTEGIRQPPAYLMCPREPLTARQ